MTRDADDWEQKGKTLENVKLCIKYVQAYSSYKYITSRYKVKTETQTWLVQHTSVMSLKYIKSKSAGYSGFLLYHRSTVCNEKINRKTMYRNSVKY